MSIYPAWRWSQASRNFLKYCRIILEIHFDWTLISVINPQNIFGNQTLRLQNNYNFTQFLEFKTKFVNKHKWDARNFTNKIRVAWLVNMFPLKIVCPCAKLIMHRIWKCVSLISSPYMQHSPFGNSSGTRLARSCPVGRRIPDELAPQLFRKTCLLKCLTFYWHTIRTRSAIRAVESTNNFPRVAVMTFSQFTLLLVLARLYCQIQFIKSSAPFWENTHLWQTDHLFWRTC